MRRDFQTQGSISQYEALIIAEQFSQVRASRLDGVHATNGWTLTPGEDREMTGPEPKQSRANPDPLSGDNDPKRKT